MSSRHALICAPMMPEFDRESGSRRLFDLIEYLRQSGWLVSFVARKAEEPRYVRLLQQRGVAVYVGFNTRLEQLVDAGRFDLAILSFWHVAEELLGLVRRLSPETPILIDSVDLHFVRNARALRQQRGEGNEPRFFDQRFADEMVRELNWYASADGVLTVSRKEAELIGDLLNDASLTHCVPDAESLELSGVPCAGRRGVLFIGNFRHAPNVQAVEFLCREVLPHVDKSLLAEHPLSIVGNGLNDTVREAAHRLEHVQLVGWVPSVLPYLNKARLSVIPLLYGAGTKRKLIQSLMVGTPSVSTTIGIESLQLEHEQDVLVADDPHEFARSIELLLREEQLWERLRIAGREHVCRLHGPSTARECLLAAIEQVRQKPRKTELPPHLSTRLVERTEYDRVAENVQAAVNNLPPQSKLLVVSKGDPRLLECQGRLAEHFPQAEGGGYAGHYPVDGKQALDHLAALHARGSQYVVFPATSFWWLEHYKELDQYLNSQCHAVHNDDCCRIYQLNGSLPKPAQTIATPVKSSLDPSFVTRTRPTTVERAIARQSPSAVQRVLVYGVYLANQANTVEHIVAELGSSSHQVTQRWISLFGEPPSPKVAAVTVRQIQQKTPKFQLLNELLAAENLDAYDYVLLTDDDVVLPDNFLDNYLSLQASLDFVIAQPARTSNSYIDHPIVEQQQGVTARRTLFVEIGPVVSFSRAVYDMVFPFDLTSPMGWGYENVWSRRVHQRGLKMGIVDATPVDHSLRKPVANYSWAEADRQRKAYLARQDHYPLDQCFRVLEVVGFPA